MAKLLALSTPPYILGFGILTGVLFVLVRWGVAPLEARCGAEGVFDRRAGGYTPDQFYAAAARFSDGDRRRYILTLTTVDMLFPIAYGLACALLFLWLSNRVNAFAALGALPVVVAVFDIAENALLALVCAACPRRNDRFVAYASLCTTQKWLGVRLAVLAFVALVLMRSAEIAVKWL